MNLTTTSGGGGLGFLNPKNEKTQRLLGWIVLGAVGFGVGNWLLPILLGIAWTALKLVLVGLVLALLLYLIFDKRMRYLAGFLLQRFISLLVSAVVRTDPIGVMEYYLREVNDNYDELGERISEVQGALAQAERNLAQNERELEDADGIVKAGRAKGNGANQDALRTAANMAQRRERSITRIKGEIEQLKAIIALLDRYRNKADAYRRDLADNIAFTKRERKRVRTSFLALKAAKRILMGGTVGAEMYADAAETNDEQIAMMVGDMRDFVMQSRGIIESFELEQDGAVQQVLARLEQKEQASPLIEYQPGDLAETAVDGERQTVGADIDRFLRH